MKVLLTKEFPDDDLKYIRSGVNSDIELVSPKSYLPADIIAAFKACKPSVILGSYFDNSFLKSEGLKLIQLPWNGYDSIDLGELRSSHVLFANSRGSSSYIADFAVALFLNGVMKISYFDNLSRARDSFDSSVKRERFYSSLSDLKVAVIGYGSIGKYLRHKLVGLNVNVDSYAKTERYEDGTLINTMESFSPSEYDALLITLPKNKDSIHLIGGGFPISSLKSGAVVVNVGRGTTLKESEVIADLQNSSSSRIWVSDVFSKEFLGNSIATESARVLISPYRAGWLKNRKPHLDDAIHNINALNSDKELINIVR